MTKKAENLNNVRTPSLNIAGIMCRIFGHKYILKRKITPYLWEIKCKRCGVEFGMHDELRCVLPLDDELRACNDDLVKLYGT